MLENHLTNLRQTFHKYDRSLSIHENLYYFCFYYERLILLHSGIEPGTLETWDVAMITTPSVHCFCLKLV